MSKTSFVVGMTIAGGVGSSFLGAFKTVEQRLESLASRQEKVNKKLKAAGDVVKYGGAVERLTARQQRLGRSNERLDRVLGEVTRRYKAATREARSYGIEVGQAASAQQRLQREMKTIARQQRGLRLQQQAGGYLRELRTRALAAGAALYGVGRLMGRAMELEEQGLFLGTVINAPDRDAAVSRARAHARQQARTTLASESEMLQIEYSLNSAGLQEEAARAGSAIVHRVATVTRGSAQQVGAMMGVAFNNLAGGMEGTAEEKLRRIGDVLAKTQQMFQIEDFSGLGEGLKHGVKAAVNYKVSLEQTAAALGVLNSAGQQGGMAGTAFAAMLRNLGKAAEEYGTEARARREGPAQPHRHHRTAPRCARGPGRRRARRRAAEDVRRRGAGGHHPAAGAALRARGRLRRGARGGAAWPGGRAIPEIPGVRPRAMEDIRRERRHGRQDFRRHPAAGAQRRPRADDRGGDLGRLDDRAVPGARLRRGWVRGRPRRAGSRRNAGERGRVGVRGDSGPHPVEARPRRRRDEGMGRP